jgi:hypothetical protein
MIEKQIALLSEAHIVTLTNKGMYKRALKAMEKEEVQMIKPYHFKIGQENIVFSGQLENFKCTCPATGYCKHAVMSNLYMMSKKVDKNEGQPLTLADFDEIKQVTAKMLRGYVTQNTINDALIDIELNKISYHLEGCLQVNLETKGQVTISYPFSLEKALKQNKEKDLIQAIKYIQHLNGIDGLQLVFRLPNPQVLEEMKSYFEDVISNGLYNLKESDLETIDFLSIKLRLEKYTFLAKRLQYFKKMLEDYLNGRIETPFEKVKDIFMGIFMDISILLGQASDEEKYRLFRKTTQGLDVEEISAYGLAYDVVTLSDERKLIHTMLLDRVSGRIYELSNLRKSSYLKNNRLSDMSLFFQDSQSARSLMDKSFKLKNVKLKENNRLSNDGKISLSFSEDIAIDLLDYGQRVDKMLYKFLKEGQECFILSSKIENFYDIGFKEATQRFEIYVGGLCTYYAYEGESDHIIDRLKGLKHIDYLLIKLKRKDFYIEGKIIAMWSGQDKIYLGES